ncbi:AraC family transcriptional regulator [Pontivivens ytuae]|uniref:AraC family transcriptional regulator ligand-binding domain-containing protein n=1 Tax=Pontivivens ytuae TaxID=2789856 RepID=A0A7S9LRS9_9RHOB|nr:AraC family transcriptional regulator [Pontivivens ytuae]QPH53951.1 AraC family transcriptional regulator ligand-binding domain-containing protein [Pontivivens ytuae]
MTGELEEGMLRRALWTAYSDDTTRASIISTVANYAMSHGMTMAEIEAATGLTGFDLVDPERRLPDDVLPKLWNAFAAKSPVQANPMELARAAPLSVFGGLAHGAQFAGTLRSALKLLSDNAILLSNSAVITLEEDAHEARFISHHPKNAEDGGRMSQFAMALAVRLLRDLEGAQDFLHRIDFAQPANGPVESYERVFGVPVRFDQARNVMVVVREKLDTAIRHANPELFAYVEAHFAQERHRLEESMDPAPLKKLRRAILRNALSGIYRPAQAAAEARMSLRAAQRLARAHGTTLQRLIDEVRMAAARALLAAPDSDIANIAAIVGYADERAFRRAFRRLVSQSPSAYRADHGRRVAPAPGGFL